jgi:anhydro-N-acetylmuramic acid kinase
MSGTSLDGVDAVLARFDSQGRPTLLSRSSTDFPPALQAELLALNASGPDELGRAALAANTLVKLYARAVEHTLALAEVSPKQVSALGAHGQTVRHRPELGYTIQLNAPALLAELTGISVIADFRSRDVAAGGQGAPLVPIFHAGIFSVPHTRVIVNLGGIANITVLRPQQPPFGFDTGPANVLMDMWCAQHTGHNFDQNGAWGADGEPNRALLSVLIGSEPWFARPV